MPSHPATLPRKPLTSIYVPDQKAKPMTRSSTYNPLDKDIDSLMDSCEDLEDFTYAIQKLTFAAKKLVELDKSDIPDVKIGQYWRHGNNQWAIVKPSYNQDYKLVDIEDKEIIKTDNPLKIRLWLFKRHATLVASSLHELVTLASPQTTATTPTKQA